MLQVILNLADYITSQQHFEIYNQLMEKIQEFTTVGENIQALKTAQRNLEWVVLNRDRVKREVDGHLNGGASTLISCLLMVVASVFITQNL